LALAKNLEGFGNLPGFGVERREKCQRLKFSEISGRFSKPAGCEIAIIKFVGGNNMNYG